jgi:hypothetical protein
MSTSVIPIEKKKDGKISVKDLLQFGRLNNIRQRETIKLYLGPEKPLYLIGNVAIRLDDERLKETRSNIH